MKQIDTRYIEEMSTVQYKFQTTNNIEQKKGPQSVICASIDLFMHT